MNNQQGSGNIGRIYPTVLELLHPLKNIQCPVDNCLKTVQSQSNLSFHLIKVHKRTPAEKTKNPINNGNPQMYLCPIETCPHHQVSPFYRLKNLRQHYCKVHVAKDWLCCRCQQRFTWQQRRQHAINCGVHFKCQNCAVVYAAYETLLTHCRRHRHHCLSKAAYRTLMTARTVSETLSTDAVKRFRRIASKPTVEQSTQTVDTLMRTPQSQRKSSCTQTTTETKQLLMASSTPGDDGKNRLKIQTTSSAFSLNDFDFSMSISTQTAATVLVDEDPVLSCHQHTETQTETANDFQQKMESEAAVDVLFESDDMYTQTCSDDWRLDEEAIILNDTETQTGYEDFLRSVESQTIMSHYLATTTAATTTPTRELSHMETQTDGQFKKFLSYIDL